MDVKRASADEGIVFFFEKVSVQSRKHLRPKKIRPRTPFRSRKKSRFGPKNPFLASASVKDPRPPLHLCILSSPLLPSTAPDVRRP